MKKLRTRDRDPRISLLKDKFEHNEITCPSDVTEGSITNAILAIYQGLAPRIFGVEKRDGNIEIISGTQIVNSICHYLCCNIPYAKNGELKEFQGKTFSELPRYLQRELQDSALRMTTFECEHDNIVDEVTFRTAVKALHELV